MEGLVGGGAGGGGWGEVLPGGSRWGSAGEAGACRARRGRWKGVGGGGARWG